MSAYYEAQVHYTAPAVVDFDTADAEATFTPTVPVNVTKVRIVLTEATSAAASVVTVGIRDADDAAGSDVVTNLGSFSLAAGLAANTLYEIEIAGVDPDAVVPTGEHSQPAEVTMGRVDGYQTNLPGEIEVNPGQTFVVQSNGAGTGGAAVVQIQYYVEDEDLTRAVPVQIAFTRA